MMGEGGLHVTTWLWIYCSSTFHGNLHLLSQSTSYNVVNNNTTVIPKVVLPARVHLCRNQSWEIHAKICKMLHCADVTEIPEGWTRAPNFCSFPHRHVLFLFVKWIMSYSTQVLWSRWGCSVLTLLCKYYLIYYEYLRLKHFSWP